MKKKSVHVMGMTRFAQRAALASLSLAALSVFSQAQALTFEIPIGDGAIKGSLNNAATMGASFRIQDRDDRYVGKANLWALENPNTPNPCTVDDCLASDPGDGAPNQRYLDMMGGRGAHSMNGDDGNINYDRGDVVAATAKLTTDFGMSYKGFGFFSRTIMFYDVANTDFNERHPARIIGANAAAGAGLNGAGGCAGTANGAHAGLATLLQPDQERCVGRTTTRREKSVEEDIGADIDLLEGYFYGAIPIGEREISFKIGRQTLNWGESTAIVINSLNTINPPDANRLFVPGGDLKEVFIPVPLVSATFNLFPSVTLGAFYQTKWERAQVPAPGGFFSTADLGTPGGNFGALEFAKMPEDPYQLQRPASSLFRTIADTSFSALRDPDNTPKDSGQYGVSAKFDVPIGNGLALGFYHANYHSRLPYLSGKGGDYSCANARRNPTADMDGNGVIDTTAEYSAACVATNTIGETVRAEKVKIFLDYPEDIKLYGISFNTTIGDLSVQGEWAYRPNLPLQLDATDVISAALKSSFPDRTVDSGVGIVIPSGYTAVPDIVNTFYRGNPNGRVFSCNDATRPFAGQFNDSCIVRGYERFEVSQPNLGFTYAFGASDNIFGADQILLVGELGATWVHNLPNATELPLEAPGTDTQITSGVNGYGNARFNAGNAVGCDGANEAIPGNRAALFSTTTCALRQNPIEADLSRLPTDFSWGYRLISIIKYQNVLPGLNIEPFVLWTHDINGIAPGPGENFLEGRKSLLTNINFVYGQLTTTLGYQMYTGAGGRNPMADRDTASLVLRYEF